MTANDEDLGDDLQKPYSPDETKILRQEIELLNGVRMCQADARAEYMLLCELYEDEPALFHALIALVKDPSSVVQPEITTALRAQRCLLDADGAVRADLAAVLDAAFQPESPDGIPLRYPIRHASREQAEQISKIYDLVPGTEIPRRFLRYFGGTDGPDVNGPAR